MTEIPDLMSVREVKRLLDVTQQTVYKLIKEDKLSGIRVGNQWRIYRDSFDQFIGSNSEPTRFSIIINETFTDEKSDRRGVLELLYRDGLPREAAAVQLGVTEAKVHSLTVSALFTLRPILSDSLTYDEVQHDEFALRVLAQLFLAQGE